MEEQQPMKAMIKSVAASLPTYPFQRKRHWVMETTSGRGATMIGRSDGEEEERKKKEEDGIIYAVEWEERGNSKMDSEAAEDEGEMRIAVVVADGTGVAEQVVTTSRKRGVVIAKAGEERGAEEEEEIRVVVKKKKELEHKLWSVVYVLARPGTLWGWLRQHASWSCNMKETKKEQQNKAKKKKGGVRAVIQLWTLDLQGKEG